MADSFVTESWRYRILLFVLLFLLAFLLGQKGVPVEDGPEFLTVARLGGTSHSPGMPLLALLCRVSWVLWGSLGLRILFALMSAWALWLLADGCGHAGALLASGLLLLPAVRERLLLWDAYCLVFLLFALVLRFERRSSLLLGFFTGLGLAVHPLCVLLPIVYVDRRTDPLKTFAGLLLGLSMYLALPLYSSACAVVDWGSPDRLGSFLGQVTASGYRQAYGARMGALTATPLLAHLRSLFRFLWPALLLPAALGAAVLAKVRNRVAVRLAALLAVETAFVWMINPMAAGTSQTAVVALFVFAALAFRGVGSVDVRTGAPVAAAVLLTGLLSPNPLRDQRAAVEAALVQAPPKTCFVLKSNDLLYGCWQLKYVEDRRPDVVLLSLDNFSGWFENMVNHFNPGMDLSGSIEDVGGVDQPRERAAAGLVEMTRRMNPGRPFLTDAPSGK
ncbi:MAG: hypothetical protein R6U36_07420 [Candidatus Fermentibacteraceae bacterium]